MNGASVSVARAKTSSDSDGSSRQAQRIERRSFDGRHGDRRRRSLRRAVIGRLDVIDQAARMEIHDAFLSWLTPPHARAFGASLPPEGARAFGASLPPEGAEFA